MAKPGRRSRPVAATRDRKPASSGSASSAPRPAAKPHPKAAATAKVVAEAASKADAKPDAKPPRPVPPPEEPPPSRSLWLAEVLRDRIITGVYAPGERLREAQLRAEFGFSNGPIREALQAVVAAGLAERPPFQGVRVKRLSEREIVELFQVRLALLEYAVELAARQVTPETVAAAAELKRSIDAAFDKLDEGHPAFGGRMSQWLLAAAGNRIMREIWDNTMQQTLIYVNASFAKSRGRKSRMLLRALIDHICDGDVAAARRTARALTVQTLADLGIAGTL
ncbi:HTH-type transcriptional regulator McbR [Rhodoplanes serenus]|uniref:HTH-type transcriptional regulator McbR n=1 Tax=Rhodoplanes serenus TaxID=200615 RepID=A0A447D228_9BRAD|nr:GntR family transcriptional regulator [Rhodoplanes serenus]VCU11574.1 HTH-type transcriptional regulator McbR [Rhodoplanes serenus]